jgi:hypothetical protein
MATKNIAGLHMQQKYWFMFMLRISLPICPCVKLIFILTYMNLLDDNLDTMKKNTQTLIDPVIKLV